MSKLGKSLKKPTNNFNKRLKEKKRNYIEYVLALKTFGTHDINNNNNNRTWAIARKFQTLMKI